MRISIITVAYNAKDTIDDAMHSVLMQKTSTCSGKSSSFELEYVIVDGGSTDGTVEVIGKFEAEVKKALRSHFSFKWVSEPDNGLYDAMNKGVQLSTGDFIGIVNADDMLASDDVLGRVAYEFARNPQVEFLYSDVRFVDRNVRLPDLHLARTRRYVCPFLWRPWMLTFGYAPPHPGQYIRRRCFDAWGCYKHEYRIGADYEMNVRFVRRNKAKYSYMRKCAVAMRLGGMSTKKGKAGSFIENNYDVIRANRENGYAGSKWLLLGKLPIKFMELAITSLFPHLGA